MSKRNCWEFKNCGRGPYSDDSCPAATERRADGIHGGMNAGRCCWVVAGTLCGGQVQGSFAAKLDNCLACDFYNEVRREEVGTFRLTFGIVKQIQAAGDSPSSRIG